MAASRLNSLLVTYSFEDYDSFGLRAIVPRAVPLNPPFTPSTLEYNIEVPSTVENLGFETPHCNEAQVEVAGNTGLQYGNNIVKLMLTNLHTGERVDYILKVLRKRNRGFLCRLATLGALASVMIVGAVLVGHRASKDKRTSSERLDGISYWRRKVGSFLDELSHPLI